MDKVISIKGFLEEKLASCNARMQSFIAEASKTIDEAVERNDFNLIVKARDLTDQAVKENDKIKRLRQLLHIETAKVNVEIKQNNG